MIAGRPRDALTDGSLSILIRLSRVILMPPLIDAETRPISKACGNGGKSEPLLLRDLPALPERG
jgi:hypothetical protein